MSANKPSQKRAALGRGLEALLPGSAMAGETASESGDEGVHSPLYEFDDRVRMLGRVADIPTEMIDRNPYQPREKFDETALEELASSITQLGIIQPITVRSTGNGRFELIAGERRWRASRIAGLDKIPAYVRDADTESMLEMAIVENVQREELDPIEIALGYQRLMEECELTQDQVAEKIGKNRATIANFVRLLKLPPTVQLSLRAQKISAGHARALLPLNSADEQIALLNKIERQQLSVRQVEHRVKAILNPPSKQRKEKVATVDNAGDTRDRLQLQAYADQLRVQYGTKINIKHQPSDATGRIEIDYYSVDDLERLMEVLLR
ncbi:MAG: ParB/RepB/Spo0J family partition protein [Rhodothermales bacterium]|nr:ParB/RepB/Spo0J family partition protein [Rhodothermales bacterium]